MKLNLIDASLSSSSSEKPLAIFKDKKIEKSSFTERLNMNETKEV